MTSSQTRTSPRRHRRPAKLPWSASLARTPLAATLFFSHPRLDLTRPSVDFRADVPSPPSRPPFSHSESIRSKLSSSLASLKDEEQRLTTELEAALKGAQKAGEMDPSGGAKGASSLALKREIEEIREKVQRMSEKRQLSDWPDVAAKKAAVKECYL